MKQLVLIPAVLIVILLLQSCKDEALIYAPQTYGYLQHSSYSIDTSEFMATGRMSYTVTMQNIGTADAHIIRTQLIFKEPTTNPLQTTYIKWINTDSSNVTIPAGGSVTYTVRDSMAYRDSVEYWNLSYNSNPSNNQP